MIILKICVTLKMSDQSLYNTKLFFFQKF